VLVVGLFQVKAAVEAVGFEDVADAAVEAFDHSNGLGRPDETARRYFLVTEGLRGLQRGVIPMMSWPGLLPINDGTPMGWAHRNYIEPASCWHPHADHGPRRPPGVIRDEGSGDRRTATTETVITTETMRPLSLAERRFTGTTPLPKS